MYKRLGKIVLMICITSFFSCKTLEINKVYKEKHIAALSNLNNYIVYVVKVNAKSSFTLNSIELTSNGSTQKIKNYSFTNLKTSSGHAVLDKVKTYYKGNYVFSFKIEDEAFYNRNDFLNINYTIANKTYNYTSKEVTKQDTFINK